MAEEEAEDQKVRQSARDSLDRLSSDDKVICVMCESLLLCSYVYMCVCVCVHVCVWRMYVWRMCACMHVCVCMCVCVCACVCVHTCVHV